MKKYISILMTIIMLLTFTSGTFAEFSDVPSTESYAAALNRLSELGIMSGDENGFFNPDTLLTREGFAKIIVAASGLESNAKALMGATIFTDIPVNHWSTGYINLAVDKGYIAGRPDGTFDPAGKITFLEVCTGIIKVLGYEEKDLIGSWPMNYLNKISQLGLIKGIDLNTGDGVPRWVAAVMIDRLLSTPVKTTGSEEQPFAQLANLYTECIVLADSSISPVLSKDQIITDKGALYIKDTSKTLQIGGKYAVSIDGNNIVKVFYPLTTVDNFTILAAKNKSITYSRFFQTNTMLLPENVIYYHNGTKVNYDALDGIISMNSSIVFAWNRNRTAYEYAVIANPIFSKPELARDFNPARGRLGNIEFKDYRIIRNGQIINLSEIKENDVVYLVSDLWRTNQYILVVDNKVQGNIEGILPNYLTPEVLRIGGKNYEFSDYMDLSKIRTVSSEFKIGDNVIAILGYDDKVIDMYKPDDYGVEEEIIIIETSDTSPWLSENQVSTDKGTYYFPEGTKPELGMKYNAFIKNDKIIKINEKLSTVTGLTVDSIVGNRITYTDYSSKTMVLPQDIEYYYNGSKLSGADSLRNILQVNTSIFFADCDERIGYEYAVVVDPIYSKPQIAVNFNHTVKEIGNINLVSSKIIKNGEIIKVSDIKDNDVIYEVSDYRNTQKYVLVLDKNVDGTITGIFPNKLSPNKIRIGDVDFELSPDLDYSKITNTTNAFKINDKVKVLLGHDGKVVDIVYTPEDDTSNFAYVINFQKTISTDLKDYGETLYFVKLLHTNGLVATYKSETNPASYKGTLVTFTKTDLDPDPNVEDIMVTLTQVPLIGKWKEYNINKNDKMIDNNFVTENVTIINSINSAGGGDAEYDFLNWDELPHGIIKEGKIICMNHVGEFDDINLILLNDLYDQKYKYAVVTEIVQLTDFSEIHMLIDGVPHIFYSQEKVSGEFGSVIKVKYVNGTVSNIIEWIQPATQSDKIQAVDSRRIRIDNVIYPFKENVNIYFKNIYGSFTLRGIDMIDTTKTYGKVSVYLTDPLEQRGKVDTIVIYE